MSETGLWSWAVRVYGVPGVSEACLDLQDAHGQNAPLLLWAGWCARDGRALDADTIEAACDTARAWDEAAVSPLRALRRTLKLAIPDVDDAARLALREQVKAVELAAERHLLEALEGLASPSDGSDKPVADALVRVARQWSRIVPRPALVRLAEALPA